MIRSDLQIDFSDPNVLMKPPNKQKRTTIMGVKSIHIKEGSHVTLTSSVSEYYTCNEHKIYVDNIYLTSEVVIGMEICIGQEEIVLHCTVIIGEKEIKCLVSKGGELIDLSYVSMRGGKRKRPTLGKIDYEMAKFALEYQVDMLIINYVHHAGTLKNIKKFIGHKVRRPYLISGICTQQGLDNIDDIAKLGKPYFISGAVFQDTLINGEYSDREVSDMTNALFEGASGFILKDYLNIDHVLEAVRSISDLCRAVEPYTKSNTEFWRLIDEIKMPLNAAEACMIACVSAANQTQAPVVVIPTVTGSTTRTLLRMNPVCTVITCFRSCIRVGEQQENWSLNVEAKVNFAIEYAVKRGWLTYEDRHVTLQRGTEYSSYCDTVRLWTVTISKKALVECLDDEEKEEQKYA